VTGAEALLLLIPALYEHTTHERSAWLGFAGACIGLSVFASVIGNAFWNRMSRLLPLTMTGQMILFETLFALLYCFLWERRWPHGKRAAVYVDAPHTCPIRKSRHARPSLPTGIARLAPVRLQNTSIQKAPTRGALGRRH